MKREKYFFNSATEKKRLEIKFDRNTARQQLLEMGFKKGMSFLDAGCGTGAMLRVVRELDPKNKRIYGIDANKELLHHAARLAARHKAKYCASNTYKLPFKNGSLDFIWTRFMLEHLTDPYLAMGEMKRVLKKGGILAAGDLDGNCVFHYPLNHQLKSDLDTIIKILSPYGFDPFIGRKLFSFFRRLSLKKIQVKLYPYHNIFGEPNEKDWANWNTKIDQTMRFVKKISSLPNNRIEAIKKRMLLYVLDKNTYTYSVLIFAKGIK